MGCFSSRSTIAPTDSNEDLSGKTTGIKTTGPANGHTFGMPSKINGVQADKIRQTDTADRSSRKFDERNVAATHQDQQQNLQTNSSRGKTDSPNSSIEAPDDDIMSILISSQEKSSEQENLPMNNQVSSMGDTGSVTGEEPTSILHDELERDRKEAIIHINGSSSSNQVAQLTDSGRKSTGGGGGGGASSFDDEPNLDLLRQYIAVDYEITQLEDKDALRVYHEKIEQLEQLERELDMISSEAEEVAVRNDSNFGSPSGRGSVQLMDSKIDGENNSILSDATGSMSHKSWLADDQRLKEVAGSKQGRMAGASVSATNTNNSKINRAALDSGSIADTANSKRSNRSRRNNNANSSTTTNNNNHNLSYSTIEEVFNRKIILEKERDKLKKEVEIVIVECDKLQQRYKRRDEILDKLFDGRTGGGLENHLEQQLNWLLEQKHYVDQVFYAWKRAETLTSQTCEQFASALELLKRLPKIEDAEQRSEIVNNIGQLLIKSRQDMEQAQKYNPNVDAPFFTENETERFDRIIDMITNFSNKSKPQQPQLSQPPPPPPPLQPPLQPPPQPPLSPTPTPTPSSATQPSSSSASPIDAPYSLINLSSSSISPTAYSQILTVIQFAYKRAVSIRLWLEQILQTTIARDTFELAEEYKWIAIQLRKERINLIKLKLQEEPYQAMAQSVKEQIERQQSLVDSRRQHEINRDSGVESETNDIDIEEEIYRLLELNKWRLEVVAATPSSSTTTPAQVDNPTSAMMPSQATSSDKSKAVPAASASAASLLGGGGQKPAKAGGSLTSPLAAPSWRDTNNMDSSAAQVRQRDAPDRNTPSAGNDLAATTKTSSVSSGFTMPTKLKIELDEDLRQSLLSKYQVSE